MTKMTSAYANKVLKKLAEDKEYLIRKERSSYTYIAAVDEEPVIPEYDYSAVAAEIAAIDDKIVKIKHAINVNNVTRDIINLCDIRQSVRITGRSNFDLPVLCCRKFNSF